MKLMFKNKILICGLILLILSGCSYKETSIQSRDIGYLKFNKSGNSSYIVIINDNYEIKLKNCVQDVNTGTCFDDTKDKLYEISSGNINIKVYDEKKNLIVNKNFYLSSSSTIEVGL